MSEDRWRLRAKAAQRLFNFEVDGRGHDRCDSIWYDVYKCIISLDLEVLCANRLHLNIWRSISAHSWILLQVVPLLNCLACPLISRFQLICMLRLATGA